ncbi:glycosyl transferase (plasmid) [Haloarcula hispanica N601]|uniref:Glycosyl transferase n=2 Tax=Haloarcula hispanica TaxID=51589 RepID=V5TUB4_HALHI|nr:glycosyltransferase family 4 protein [Haloarcula hispanica]AEM59304.1 glycosyltransferase [Haloarcula hispanica ATCC 33960]AHB68159.1 glycosyl transferase [Haloarcula hispanica N601]
MSERTRQIGIISQQYPPDKSGHASRIQNMATNLDSRGWDVEVVAPPPCFPHGSFDRDWYRSKEIRQQDVTVRRLWAWQPTEPNPGIVSRLAYYVTFALHAFLWLLITRRRYDVVMTTTPPISTGLAGFVTVLTNSLWVVDVRDLWIDASVSLGFIPEDGIIEHGSRYFQRQVLHTSDAIAVTTETLGDHLCEQYGAALSEKLLLVPNGVDMDRFASTKSGDSVVDSDDPAIVYVGNIGHAQALDECIRAMGRLNNDAELYLIGSGDAVPHLREVVTEGGVEDAVEFTGPIPHEAVPAALDDAAIGIAPLLDDSELDYAMPTKVYEYMGAGLPVVTTGQGELERFIEQSGGGIHTTPDPGGIATAFDSLLASEAKRRERGQSGQDYVSPTYDRSHIAVRFDDQIRQLMDGTSTAPAGESNRTDIALDHGTTTDAGPRNE